MLCDIAQIGPHSFLCESGNFASRGTFHCCSEFRPLASFFSPSPSSTHIPKCGGTTANKLTLCGPLQISQVESYTNRTRTSSINIGLSAPRQWAGQDLSLPMLSPRAAQEACLCCGISRPRVPATALPSGSPRLREHFKQTNK